MRDSRPSFILFLVASFGVIIGKILDAETVQLICKPMVVPAIYYYYLQTRTVKTSVWFSMVFVLLFLGDMFMLLDPISGLVGIMACSIVAHMILIKFALEDRIRLKLSLFNIFFLILLLLLPSYILYMLLHLSVNSIDDHYLFFLIYGIVLIALVGISIINYLSHNDSSSLYFCAMALSLMVSDVLYSIAHFIIDMPLLDHVNLAMQFMAYFFMVKYFNSRKIDFGNVTSA